MPNPPYPLPEPRNRAYAADVAETLKLPISTIYDLMERGQLPCWKLGLKKKCTDWIAVRKFFGLEAG